MFPQLYLFGDYSFFAVRLVLGIILLAHGWPKIKNLRQTGVNFSSMGFHPGFFWGTVAAVAEFFGGLALLAGFYVQIAAALLVGEFIVINIWRILKKNSFVGGLEFDLLILSALLVLLTQGGGEYALERMFFWPY